MLALALLVALALAPVVGAAPATVEPGPGALQAAIDRLPESGGEIRLKPGVYREKVALAKSNVRLRGLGRRPQDVTIVWSDSSRTVGGTLKSATFTITGDGVRVENLTVQNDYWLKRPDQPSQAVALAVTGDRAVFDKVRLLGHQDTLYAGSKLKCEGLGCGASRQLFRDCYVEGHVDFIFGDAKAYFQRCHIHGVTHPEVMITAQSKNSPGQDSGYVFDGCRITADPGVGQLWLGRAWRPYATVVFLRTRIDAALQPAGWREWTPGKTETFKTAYYAEYASSGRGADLDRREPSSHPLTAEQARAWSFETFMSGKDGWRP